MAKLPPFPLEIIRDRLSYNAETGVLSWIVVPSNNVQAASRAGAVLKIGYRKIVMNNYQMYAHHVAWYMHHGKWPESQIDHVNGDRDDNRILNLRLATQAQQNFNTKLPCSNTSGHKGVARCSKTNRWRAYIVLNRKQKFLGNYDNFGSAVAARKAAEVEICGEFARINP